MKLFTTSAGEYDTILGLNSKTVVAKGSGVDTYWNTEMADRWDTPMTDLWETEMDTEIP